MRSRLQTTRVVLSMFLSVGIVSLNAHGQTAGALPSDVTAANRELNRQLLEGHRLLDAEKVLGLFTNSPDIFFIAPDGELYKGPRPSPPSLGTVLCEPAIDPGRDQPHFSPPLLCWYKRNAEGKDDTL